MKKVFVSFAVIVTSLFGLAVFAPTPASAACGNFLNFPTWYRGLENADCELDMDTLRDKGLGVVWVVVLNIIDIVLRIMGIMAVGFIIYGGYRFLTSAGSPDKAAAARDTILKAVIGLVIAIGAASIVSFLVTRLGA